LDRPRSGRVSRPRGLRGTPADRQSRIRGVRWSIAAALLVAGFAWAATSLWQRLERDGIHDPRSPAIGLLQQPGEALDPLPRDGAGNLVNWVKAIDSGAINPRTNLLPETQVRLREDDFIIAKFGSMPAVKFPHRQHTLWLACENCHDILFKAKAGANKFSMTAILNGEQCGVCHGAVAFPLTECNRCHSVSNASLMRRPATP
jgi:c(7)-type cytochrome triheme protein